jgi:hypothetical protein
VSEGGRRELSSGGLSHAGVSHRLGPVMKMMSSHESRGPVMSHGGSSHESRWVPSRTAGPVGGSSRWVQSVGPVKGSRS